MSDENPHKLTHETANDKTGDVRMPPEERLQDLQTRIIELEIQNAELRDRQTELETTCNLIHRLVRDMPVPFFSINRYNVAEDVNEAACMLIGTPREELVKKKFTSFIASEDTDRYYLHRRDVLRHAHSRTVNIRLINRSVQETIPVALSGLNAGNGRLYMIAMPLGYTVYSSGADLQKYVTESETSEDRIRSLSNRLLEAQEKEAQRIGHDLHDIVGSSLTVLKLAIHEARKKLPEGQKGILDQIDELTISLAHDVRSLSHSLRIAEVEKVGLEEALLAYVDNLKNQIGIEVCLQYDELPEQIPNTIRITAFRIIQEALNNVVKHADTSQATVMLRRHSENLIVTVEDNGRGFDATQPPPDTGGLSGMKDRAVLAGGTLEIESDPGKGTRISAILPLQQ